MAGRRGQFRDRARHAWAIAGVRSRSIKEAPRLPYWKLAEDILARWREAERALVAASDSDVGPLRTEIEGLKAAYQRLVDEAQAAQREEPPPFPAEP